MPTVKIVPFPGAPGPRGQAGPRGYQGDTGLTGASGSDGASAYEIAVENGFEGTEQEWVDSLGNAANIGNFVFDENEVTTGEPMTIGVTGVPGDITLSSYLGVNLQFADTEGAGLRFPDNTLQTTAWTGELSQLMRFGASGSYISTITQTPVSAGSIQPIVLDAALWEQGVELQNDSELKFTVGGKYNIAFSVQIVQGNGNANVNIWINKNGVPVPWSNTHVYVAANTPDIVAAWNFFVDASAGDYYQLVWSSTSSHTELQIHSETGSGVSLHPAVPSVIVTVNQIG